MSRRTATSPRALAAMLANPAVRVASESLPAGPADDGTGSATAPNLLPRRSFSPHPGKDSENYSEPIPPVEFVVPGRPQPWQRAGTRDGRHYVKPETAAYKRLIATVALEAMAGREPMEGPVRLETDFAFPVPASYSERRRTACLAGENYPIHKLDFDNLAKSLADALSGIVWRDDGQVVEAVVGKRYAAAPGLRVKVERVCRRARVPSDPSSTSWW